MPRDCPKVRTPTGLGRHQASQNKRSQSTTRTRGMCSFGFFLLLGDTFSQLIFLFAGCSCAGACPRHLSPSL